MKITNIYNQYKIPSNLQTHMLRVTAVAQMICDNWTVPLVPSPSDPEEKRNIITAGLLHDMGNIIKFDLDLFPGVLEKEGIGYWSKVKQGFIDKYGSDEHHASYEIAREIGVNDRTLGLIQSIGFTKSMINFEGTDFSKKICCYSDQRVSPYGVTSLHERITEGKKRFVKNKNIQDKDKQKFEEQHEFFGSYLLRIETQIFENSKIKPEDIKDDSIASYIDELKEFEI